MRAAPGNDRLRNDRLRLVLLSSLMLFVELALIRWTGSNVVYLSYFSNFVLLGSFLGIGIGFLRARAARDLFPWALPVLAVFVAFVRTVPVEVDRAGSDLIYFGVFTTTGLPTWVMLPAIFLAVAVVMMMIAEGVARVFVRFDALEAYRLDIVGSLIGIAAFSVLALLHAPPVWWGVLVGALFLALLAPRIHVFHLAAALVIFGALLAETLNPAFSWSPYYRVELDQRAEDRWRVSVNGIPHQAITTVEHRRETEPIYFTPYERTANPSPENVLIVGAGNGTDVAIALGQGVRHVDAVEIDPVIQGLGDSLHPNHPYDDPRVEVHIADGRAFLERTDRRYDLILFALPDSLTLVSGQSSLRLESYLFTVEAMRAARAHLSEHGAFGMYNYYRERWLVERLARTLQEVYGHAPCTEDVGDQGHLALLMATNDPVDLSCPAAFESATATSPATDDHPFLYLKDRAIPAFYLLTIALILAASVLFIRAAAGPFRRMRAYVDLFFMGVAFLLLETKSVVQFALLFGTTWFVNALVFAGILLSVLFAIEVARRVRFRNPRALYGALLVAIGVAFAVPQHALLELSALPRFVVATALAFAPIFLANLVFAERFRDVEEPTTAFGANLLGAMLGGVLEYVALVTGYRALLVVVAVAYGIAFLVGRRTLTLTRV